MPSFMTPFRLDDTTTPTSAGFSGPVTSLASQPPLPRRELVNSLDPMSQASTPHRPSTPPLLTPAPGIAFTAHVKSWGPQQIATFLSIYKCDNYTALFHQNDIDGKVLLDLDMASLKEIGIGKIGDRVKLLGGVRDLRKRAAKGNLSASGNGLGAATGSPSRNGSPVPAFEYEGKGAQVPQRLANASTSTRLKLFRPPPIIVPPPHPTANPPMAVSPSGRSLITPKPDTRVIALPPGSVTQDAYSTTLRIPGSRERRSPSPVVDAHGGVAPRSTTDTSTSPSGIQRTGLDIATTRKFERRQPTSHRLDNTPRSASPPHQGPLHRNVALAPVHPFRHNGDDLRREQLTLPRGIVKFVDAEDMTTKKVHFPPDTSSGVEALEMVLRKFQKKKEGSVSSFTADIDNDSDKLEVDGWGVYVRSERGEGEAAVSLRVVSLLMSWYRYPPHRFGSPGHLPGQPCEPLRCRSNARQWTSTAESVPGAKSQEHSTVSGANRSPANLSSFSYSRCTTRCYNLDYPKPGSLNDEAPETRECAVDLVRSTRSRYRNVTLPNVVNLTIWRRCVQAKMDVQLSWPSPAIGAHL